MHGLALQKGAFSGNPGNTMNGVTKCAGVTDDRVACGRDSKRHPQYFHGKGRPVLSEYLTNCKEVLKDGATTKYILCRTCYDRCERRLANVPTATPPTPAGASPV